MIAEYFKLIRIKHWVKNGFVFVPILFAKNLFDYNSLLLVIKAFFVFGIASSAVYIFNDIIDVEIDRKHSVKKNRPIASGKISKLNGWIVVVIFIILLIISASYFRTDFNLMVLAYLLLNFFYSLYFKKIVLVDIFSIAGGFMLRVLAGAYVINVEVSSWLILTTLFISLFLGIIKRRSELAVQSGNVNTRKVLQNYSVTFLDQISAITAAGVIICYSLYSVSAKVLSNFHSGYFVYTTIFVIYGIFRYLFLAHFSNKGEDAAEIIFKDFPTFINIVLYFIIVIFIIYY